MGDISALREDGVAEHSNIVDAVQLTNKRAGVSEGQSVAEYCT